MKEEILDFWFKGVEENQPLSQNSEYAKRWFAHEASVDAVIAEQFEKHISEGNWGRYDAWQKTPEGCLALVILLDQFPRAVYRGSREAFSCDLKALEVCLKALKMKQDNDLSLYQNMFLYTPLMHSENKELQEMSLMCYRKLVKIAQDDEDPSLGFYQDMFNYAKRHYDIIQKFSRFPHRNSLLDRRSTSEERSFASQPEASFFN